MRRYDAGVDLGAGSAGRRPSEAVSPRKEELKPLELHRRDYVIYAYNALAKVVELLLEQYGARRP